MAGYASDSGDDADLKLAIALSLGQVGSPQNADNPVVLSSDDDDNDLERTPVYRKKTLPRGQGHEGSSALPSAGQTASAAAAQGSPQPDTARATSGGPSLSASSSLAGMDRKKMEEERLARLSAKRKAPDHAHAEVHRSKVLRTEPAPEHPQPGSSRSRVQDGAAGTPSTSSSSAGISDKMSARGLRFPKGVVRKTWAYGYPRKGDDIKIEEILQKNDLQLAVLSSFQWDEEWLLSKIDIKKTRLILVAFASSREQQEEMKANVPGGAIRFCFPPMLPHGNMHSKLQLLKYANYMRIVVPSGNLVSYDWGETGVMENMVFIIDLPLIEDPKVQAASRLTMFAEELMYFLRAQGLDEGLVKSLEKYDFAETSGYAFVHSIGKSHVDDAWKRTGYCGLGRAVSSLGLSSLGPIEVDYIAPSLGSVGTELVTAIYYAAQGDDGLREYHERTSKGKGNQVRFPAVALERISGHFRVYFPCDETVAQSRGGRQSAGTICAQSKWWDSDKFPRHLIHDCQSVRTGLLLHSKLLLVRCQRAAGKETVASWGYVGSANLSESGWGRLTMDRQTGNPKLTCRNWECGVLVPSPAPSSDSPSTTAATGQADLSCFLGRIPVPMIWPSEAYGKTGAKRPWLFLENR